MTTGRINQVACRAARDAPLFQGRDAHDPQRHRPSDGSARNTRAATRPSKWAHRRTRDSHRTALAAARACAVYSMGWGRTRARSLARAGARAAGTGDAALPGSAAPPVGAQRVHSVPQSTRWPRAARSTLRLVRRRTDAHRTGKGVNPSNKAGAHRSNSAKHDPGCGRAVGHAVQGHPHRNPLVGVAARTPAARVGLHQTLANSRETIHTIPRNALARARPAPIEQLEPGRARPPRLPKHRATRCRAPRASCCPSTHWRAGGRPRPLWLPAVARASRRARSTDLPRICRRRLPRARALQPCNRRGRHRAPQRCPSQRGLTRAAACLEHQGPPTSKKAARPPGLRGRRARADRTRCTPHPPRMARRWGEGQAAPPRRDLGRSGRGGLRPHHPWKHRPDPQRRWTDPLRGLRSPRHGVEPALRPSRSKCRWHTRRKPPRRRAGLSSM